MSATMSHKDDHGAAASERGTFMHVSPCAPDKAARREKKQPARRTQAGPERGSGLFVALGTVTILLAVVGLISLSVVIPYQSRKNAERLAREALAAARNVALRSSREVSSIVVETETALREVELLGDAVSEQRDALSAASVSEADRSSLTADLSAVFNSAETCLEKARDANGAALDARARAGTSKTLSLPEEIEALATKAVTDGRHARETVVALAREVAGLKERSEALQREFGTAVAVAEARRKERLEAARRAARDAKNAATEALVRTKDVRDRTISAKLKVDVVAVKADKTELSVSHLERVARNLDEVRGLAVKGASLAEEAEKLATEAESIAGEAGATRRDSPGAVLAETGRAEEKTGEALRQARSAEELAAQIDTRLAALESNIADWELKSEPEPKPEPKPVALPAAPVLPTTAKLTVVASPPGCTVWINSVQVHSWPASVPTNEEINVRVAQTGYSDARQSVTLQAGDHRMVSLQLQETVQEKKEEPKPGITGGIRRWWKRRSSPQVKSEP